MKQPMLARGGARHRGAIDTLSAGYGIVNKQPWVLLVPILLDVFLWLGPRLSLAALVTQMLSSSFTGEGVDEASRQMLEESRRNMQELANTSNLLVLLSPPMRMGVPSVLALIGGGGIAGALTLPSWGAVAGWALTSLGVGLVLGAIFRTTLSEQVRQERTGVRELPRVALLGAWRMALLLGLVLVGVVAIALPVAVVGAVLMLLAPALGIVLLMAAVVLALWLDVYLFFAPDAIFVRQVGPLRAMRDSLAVVRTNFWSAVGFIVLVTVVLAGMGQVWLMLATRGDGGKVLAILGNAYIASGLAAASMIYYRDRLPRVAVASVESESPPSA